MDICIIGGGIAGLGLAGLLHQNGMEPTVIEQADSWDRVGWGIGLWGTGVAVLHELGVAEAALDSGTAMDRYQLRNGSGDEIASYTVTDTDLEFLAIHRADLHAALREAVPQDAIRMGTRPETITETADGVTVAFDDGTEASYDIVIGADGVHSSVREDCFTRYTVTEKAIAVWSFWTDPDQVPEGTTSIWTTGTEAFLTTINGRGLANIATRVPDPDEIQPPARETLQATVDRLGEPLTSLIEDLDEDSLFCDTITTVKARNWTTDRVALAGDAAHAVNPIVGMGASLALEDAYVLANELGRDSSPGKALKRYEKRRRPAVTSMRRRAAVMEWIVFNRHPIVPYLGNAVLKHTSALAEFYYRHMSIDGLDDL